MAVVNPAEYAEALVGVSKATPVATWRSFRKLEYALERIPELKRSLIATAALSEKRRRKEVDALLHEWPAELRRLAEDLASQQALDSLTDIGRVYTRLLQRDGYPWVRIESARPLSRIEYLNIAKGLPGDRMKMLFEFSVDPDLIGGVRVAYNDEEYDLTIGGGLDRLATELEVA